MSDNYITVSVDNNTNISDDTLPYKTVIEGHENHCTAHKLSCQNDNYSKGVRNNKKTNPHNNINENNNKHRITCSSLPASSCYSSQLSHTNLSSKLSTEANKSVTNISN